MINPNQLTLEYKIFGDLIDAKDRKNNYHFKIVELEETFARKVAPYSSRIKRRNFTPTINSDLFKVFIDEREQDKFKESMITGDLNNCIFNIKFKHQLKEEDYKLESILFKLEKFFFCKDSTKYSLSSRNGLTFIDLIKNKSESGILFRKRNNNNDIEVIKDLLLKFNSMEFIKTLHLEFNKRLEANEIKKKSKQTEVSFIPDEIQGNLIKVPLVINKKKVGTSTFLICEKKIYRSNSVDSTLPNLFVKDYEVYQADGSETIAHFNLPASPDSFSQLKQMAIGG